MGKFFVSVKNKTLNYCNKHMILLQILNLYFWKSWLGPIITFVVMPIVSICLLMANANYASVIMPSVMSNPLIFIPLWFVIASVYELKKNSIVEKIFIFSKKPIYSNAIVIFFYFIILFIGFFWNLFVVYLMSLDKNDFKYNLFQSSDWGAIIFIVILSLFLAISISSMVYTFIQSQFKGQLVSFILSIFFMVFSGSMLPTTSHSPEVFTYISYFSPYKYVSSSFVIAMNSGLSPNNLYNVSIFDLSKNFVVLSASTNGNLNTIENEFVLYHSYDLCLNIFVPLILTIIFYSFSLNTRMCRRK